LGGDQAPLLLPGAGLNLNLGSYHSDEWCSHPFPDFCTSLGSIVHLKPSLRLIGRRNPPPDQAVHWQLVGSHPGGPGRCIPMTREVITHHLHNPGRASRKRCRSLLAELRDSEANSRKQSFIVPAQTKWTHVQRLNPKNKGVSPYIPLQASYRSKKQGLIHIWLYLILLATLS
jgi:hypothetical protein